MGSRIPALWSLGSEFLAPEGGAAQTLASLRPSWVALAGSALSSSVTASRCAAVRPGVNPASVRNRELVDRILDLPWL